MSMPKIPNINPEINIDRDDAINLLITSVALEELALAHILNAEGEKIQYILGTLEERDPGEVTICDILQINKSVEKTLRNVIKSEMLLQFKLENAIELDMPTEPEPETTTITGQKIWIGPAQDSIPTTIQIYLLQNGILYKTLTLDTINTSFEFKDVPVYDENGNKYVYTIDEEDVPGYLKIINGFTITNQGI